MDPQQTQHLGFAIIGVAIAIGLVIMAFLIFLFWRIFTKAGMSGALSLLLLLYPIGFLIVVCVLAFGEWKVVPLAATASPYLPPSYPPPPPPPPAFQTPPQV